MKSEKTAAFTNSAAPHAKRTSPLPANLPIFPSEQLHPTAHPTHRQLAGNCCSIHNIEAEVDRYISWPGQALAYKTGELKIRELRAKAEAVLGDAFDIRGFHEVVLGSGAIPLGVLSENVEQYIAATRDSTPTPAP